MEASSSGVSHEWLSPALTGPGSHAGCQVLPPCDTGKAAEALNLGECLKLADLKLLQHHMAVGAGPTAHRKAGPHVDAIPAARNGEKKPYPQAGSYGV